MSGAVATRGALEHAPARKEPPGGAGGLSAGTFAGPITLGPARLAMIGVALTTLYTVGAQMPFWFITAPDAGVAFFPPAGLTLAILMLTPRRTWPVWLAIIFGTELVVDLSNGQSLALAAGFALANAVEPLVSVVTLGRFASANSRPRHALVGFAICCIVIGPAVGAAIGATTSVLFGSATAWAPVALRWWLGDAVGVLVIATPIMAWLRPSLYDTKVPPVELAAMFGLAVGITLVPALIWNHPLLYGVLPVLMWAALRGGSRAVSITGLGIGFAAAWATVTGRASALLAPGAGGEQLVYVQIFLALTLLTALTLAQEVADRRRTEDLLRTAEVERVRGEAKALQAAEAERRSIARDTHDIVGHALNVMLMQAGAARRALPDDLELARKLVTSIESAGRAAFRDLDLALAKADGGVDLLAGRGLEHVPELISTMRNLGMHIELHVDGTPADLPVLVDWSAYRILEEALTNVTKHAATARVDVYLQYGDADLKITVVDDGGGASARRPKREGRGLIGIRERVTLLGGELEVGPLAGSGFQIAVALPSGRAA